MAMITAYFDESETPDQPNGYFVVAGLATEAHRWKRIERDWGHVLKEFGIEYLHMKEFAHRKKPFDKWNNTKRDELMSRCSYVLSSQKEHLHSVSWAVCAGEYRTMVSEAEKKIDIHPYLVGLQQSGANVLKLFESGSTIHQVFFVFDARPKLVGMATDKLWELKDHPKIPAHVREMISGVTPGDDKKLKPLQAADFVAYELNKHYREPKRRRRSITAINPVEGLHTVLMDRELVNKYGRPSWS